MGSITERAACWAEGFLGASIPGKSVLTVNSSKHSFTICSKWTEMYQT